MPSGRLWKAALPAITDTLLYTVPDGKVATVNASFCNTTVIPIQLRLAVSTSNNVGAADYLEYDYMLPANSVLERTGIVLSPGEMVFARAGSAGLVTHGRGFEEGV